MADFNDQPDLTIADPEDISQTKRIHEILDRRQQALDARDEVLDMLLAGEIHRSEALRYYRSRIESLIMDLWTKFETSEDEDGKPIGEEYLWQVEIDELTIEPPADVLTSRAPGYSPPEPKTRTIRGLAWFIEADGYVSATFEVRTFSPPETRMVTREIAVPMRTLDKALLVCNEFLDKTGIDADFDQTEHHTHIDEDLLREVDEWRQQNV